MRTWTSANGKFSVEATFVEMKGSEVRLKKADSEFKVEKSKLSAEDQKWLDENQ
jgi:hypothetical protein